MHAVGPEVPDRERMSGYIDGVGDNGLQVRDRGGVVAGGDGGEGGEETGRESYVGVSRSDSLQGGAVAEAAVSDCGQQGARSRLPQVWVGPRNGA